MTELSLPATNSLSTLTRNQLIDGAKTRMLGSRAFEVLVHVAEGYTNTSIAERMGISEATVVNHLTHIYLKLRIADDCNARVTATLILLREAGLLAGEVTLD